MEKYHTAEKLSLSLVRSNVAKISPPHTSVETIHFRYIFGTSTDYKYAKKKRTETEKFSAPES